jgi:hypothetical protein
MYVLFFVKEKTFQRTGVLSKLSMDDGKSHKKNEFKGEKVPGFLFSFAENAHMSSWAIFSWRYLLFRAFREQVRECERIFCFGGTFPFLLILRRSFGV